MVRKVDEVIVEIGRFSRQSLEEKIIGRSFGTGVEGIEAQRQGAVQDIGKSNKGCGGGRKIK